MSLVGGGSKKPHALLVPFPTQGHINPFLKLAKLLHNNGFHITFVNTEFNHKRLLNSRGHDALTGLPGFHFETIPDGLPPSNMDATQSIPALCHSTRNNCFLPFSNLISKLNDTHPFHAPPVTCIISDGIMSFTIKASEQFGLPNILFWTYSACGFMSFKQCKNLMERGLTPLKDANYLTNGHLDTIIDWIPGMKNIALRSLLGIYRTTDPNDMLLDFVVEQIENASKASAIILPTFDALEPDVLNALSTMFPKLYTIGPLELLLDQTSDNKFESIKCNLWKEESECLKWLDSQEPNSVLYVNFGSVIVMRPQQLVELAWGIANSKKKFLWVIRPDLVEGEASMVPPEIVAETKDRGLMVGWCPQEQVLKHPAVAGFLTHCGWNSTLESISNGIPLICCPFFNDQILNCWYICAEWGFGMEMNSDNVKRDEVEKLVRELVQGEKGKEMKKKSIEWKKMAEEATNTRGSSFLNLEKLRRRKVLMMDSAAAAPFSSNAKIEKPLHVVMFPWLAMGHIYPCFEVSKILAQKGHFVTLLSTPTIIDRLPKLPQTLSPFVKLIKLPLSPHIDKNHLPQDADSTMDIPSNKLYYLKLAYDGLQQSVAEVLKTSNPDWVFFDFAASWLPQLARSLHIPSAYFSPCPAWSICFFDTPKEQLGDAAANRTNPEDYYGPPKWISFPTKIGLRPYEVSKLFEDVKVNETGASPAFDLNKANSGCDMFVIRSSRDLEPEWLDYLAEFYNKPVVPVGLLPPSMQTRDSDEEDNSPDWLQIKAWLDTQQGSSVVYIAFGSEVKLSQDNLNELALGIELSGLPFFWVLRNLQKGSVELPDGFEDRTKDRGVVWKTWAPQPKILAHGSIGGCLTHCGSGSMIENLHFGHVLVMLPFLLDQALYSRVMEEKKVGIEIPRNQQDGSFIRSSVSKALRLAMVDEEGSAYRKNAKEMGKKFSNKELHNQYIENFVASLHNHKYI